jgi:hypothetical protein
MMIAKATTEKVSTGIASHHLLPRLAASAPNMPAVTPQTQPTGMREISNGMTRKAIVAGTLEIPNFVEEFMGGSVLRGEYP